MNFRIVQRAVFAVAAVVALGAMPVSNARADEKIPVIAVVDVPLVIQESKAGKGVQKALEAQRDTYTKEFSTREGQLRTRDQELGRQQGVLSREAYNQKRHDFEQEVADFQRDVQARRKSIEQGVNEAMQTLQHSALEVIAALVQERSINLVLAKQQVVIVEKTLDLTQEVLDRVNTKTPSVTVKFPPIKK